MGQPEQALAEYEAKVKLSPSRFNSLYGAGQNAEMAKHRDQGGRLLRATIIVKLCAGETQPVQRLPMHRLLFPRSLSKN